MRVAAFLRKTSVIPVYSRYALVSVVRFRPRPPYKVSRKSNEVQKPLGFNTLGLFCCPGASEKFRPNPATFAVTPAVTRKNRGCCRKVTASLINERRACAKGERNRALELIKSDRTIKALKLGAGRLSDGGGLYFLPFVNGGSHGWRFDYTHQGKRKTLSLGVCPQVGLAQARQKAAIARSMVAAGQDPCDDRRPTAAACGDCRAK